MLKRIARAALGDRAIARLNWMLSEPHGHGWRVVRRGESAHDPAAHLGFDAVNFPYALIPPSRLIARTRALFVFRAHHNRDDLTRLAASLDKGVFDPPGPPVGYPQPPDRG